MLKYNIANPRHGTGAGRWAHGTGAGGGRLAQARGKGGGNRLSRHIAA